jgi:hypothetical protein
MARPVYAHPAKRAYRAGISCLRQALDYVFDWLMHSPGAKVDVQNTIKTFAAAAGLNVNATAPATDAVVHSGVEVVMPQITGTYVNGYTFTVAGGVITSAVAS